MSQNIAYCTIASANYLSRVEVLETSLLKHNPGAKLHVLLCEYPEICQKLSAETGHEFVSPADVCKDWLQMSFYYDITEFNTALKPFFLEHLLKQGYASVVYFDPDIEIFGALGELESLCASYDLVLTPHNCIPIPMDHFTPSIDSVVRAGQFNLGFIGISGSDEAIRAIQWWQGVCLEYCLYDGQHRFFVDQFWADILPSFIQKFYCLRDPAFNMAYWNVFQRELRVIDGKWVTDSGELKFFHFSGLAKNDLTRVSIHQNRITAPEGSPLRKLLEEYFGKLKNAVNARFDTHPYSFANYANGEKITRAERRSFLSLPKVERDEIGNPFENASAIRKIVRVDVDRLDAAEIEADYRRHRHWSYLRLLYREYVSAIRSKGFLRANGVVIRFLFRAGKSFITK
jgi:hypothetical protein